MIFFAQACQSSPTKLRTRLSRRVQSFATIGCENSPGMQFAIRRFLHFGRQRCAAGDSRARCPQRRQISAGSCRRHGPRLCFSDLNPDAPRHDRLISGSFEKFKEGNFHYLDDTQADSCAPRYLTDALHCGAWLGQERFQPDGRGARNKEYPFCRPEQLKQDRMHALRNRY